MKISQIQLTAVREFFGEELQEEYFITDEWFLRHTEIFFDDATHTVTITIDNVNEQEYGWMKD